MPEYANEPQIKGNAGCLVIIDRKILLVRDNINKKISLPGGTSEHNEPARCTASRETREETGLSVQAGKLLHIFNNNFYLYQCLFVSEINGDISDINNDKLINIQVPDEWKHEVSEVLLYDFNFPSDDQWRFPDQYDSLKSIYVKILDNNVSGIK